MLDSVQGFNMNGSTKIILFILLMIYLISPIDAAPGPLDDAILAVLYLINFKD